MSFNSVVFLVVLAVLTLIPFGLAFEQDKAYNFVVFMSRLVVVFILRQLNSNNLHLPGIMTMYFPLPLDQWY